ncbi:MAG: carboxylating nicotinate-nucleotide diphosphorylase [Spirochaetota bacterium]
MTAVQFTDIQPLIKLAIEEDIKNGDITSMAVFGDGSVSRSVIVSKDEGIFCGSFIAEYVYAMINTQVRVSILVPEGSSVPIGARVLSIEGPTRSILEGERIVLNFLQRMCGIATRTSRAASLVGNGTIQILDTRKTLPGFRLLDKYAVAAGGGTNHRMGLYDMVMIKDNHIKAAGSITNAVQAVRSQWNDTYRIEVETTTIDEVREALAAGADIIMLDNMDRDRIEASLAEINGRALVELSGNMDEERIRSVSDLPVDFISIGALTHSVSAFDLSMKFE